MTLDQEEHDFINEVCAEDASRRLAPRLSDDPAVRLAECQSVTLSAAETQKNMVQPAFDEAAERLKFEAAFPVAQGSPVHVHVGNKLRFEGWLACARQKAEEWK